MIDSTTLKLWRKEADCSIFEYSGKAPSVEVIERFKQSDDRIISLIDRIEELEKTSMDAFDSARRHFARVAELEAALTKISELGSAQMGCTLHVEKIHFVIGLLDGWLALNKHSLKGTEAIQDAAIYLREAVNAPKTLSAKEEINE